MLNNQMGVMGMGMVQDPFNQIISQASHISLQQYPHVPDRIYPFKNPTLSQLMICQTAAAIQNSANESPFHRWLFNVCAQNNWNNDYWRKIGQLSPWALHFYIQGTNYNGNNPESLIPNVTAMWVKHAASMCLLDPSFQQQAMSYIQNDMNLANHWREQAQLFAQINALPEQAQSQMFNNNGMGMGVPMMMGGNTTNAQMAMSGVTGNSLFSQNPTVQNSTGIGGDVGGRFNRTRSEPAQQVQAQPSQQQQPKEQNRQQEVVVNQQPNNVFHEYGTPDCPEWCPNEKHPVLPAISALSHKLTIKYDSDGFPAPHIEQRNTTDMDYEKHVIPHGFGRTYRDTSSATIRAGFASLESAIDKSEQDAKTIKDIDLSQELNEYEKKVLATSTIDPDIRLVDDVNIAWLVARASRSGLDSIPGIHRTISSLVRPVLVSRSMMNLIDNLAESTTLSQLADRLRGAIPQTKADEDEDKMVVIEAVNEEITLAINRALLMNMSFRKDQLSISSFMDDYDNMITALKDGIGDAFVRAFQANEKEIIYSIFNSDLLSDEDIGDYIDGLVGEFQGKMKGTVHLLSTVVSTTLIRARAHELNFRPFSEHSGVLFEDANPLLFRLAEMLMDQNQKVLANRHLVQTIDGVTLEFTKSYLTDLPQVTVLK